jgi:hypothetical protein
MTTKENPANGGGVGKTDQLAGRVVTISAAATDEQGFRNYVLAETRAAIARLRLEINDLNVVGVALKGNLISPDEALAHLHARGVLQCLGASTWAR